MRKLHFSTLVVAAALVACINTPPSTTPGAPQGSVTNPTIGARPNTVPGAGNAGGAPAPMMSTTWPLSKREYIDLWLHSYAMLDVDTMGVPYFTRGYRDRMTALRKQRGVSSLLDQNRDKLLARMTTNPSLFTSGQFVPLYFPSWETLRQAADVFVRGSARPSTAQEEMYFSVLNSAFPSAADREWLRVFVESAEDENKRFYNEYWANETRLRAGVTAHTDTVWQRQWRPALQRFLNNTQQQNGELYLSMPLGGEGRTVLLGKGLAAMAVPSPALLSEVSNVLYVIAHEITGGTANAAINDNSTPAERRDGTTARYEQSAAVRAGAILLERVMPNVVPGYMRYYLQQAGRQAPTDPRQAFMAAFAIPDAMRDAIMKQMDIVLGGI